MSTNRISLSEGLLIAAVPVVGYWMAYLYEIAYCRFFGIPYTFIQIDLPNVLVALSGLFGILGMLWIFGEVLLPPLRVLPRVLVGSFLRVLIVLFFLLGYVVATNMAAATMLWVVMPMATLVLLVEFVLPLLTQRTTQGYLAKMEAERAADLKHDSLLDLAVKKVGVGYFSLFYCAVIFSFLAYAAGGIQARGTTEFIVIPGSPEMIGIKKYKDYLVAAKWDRSAKRIYREFRLVPFNEQLGIYTYDRVGPLEPELLTPDH